VSDLREAGERDGHVNAALANAIVHLVREYTGRGPTQARASIHGDMVTVLMGDVLTKAERKLAQGGKAEMVRHLRREFQTAMRDDMVAEVESITHRKVIAFMSDNHIDPDMAVETFVLEPRNDGASALPSA
jgi:uncharacterized protein YbcI